MERTIKFFIIMFSFILLIPLTAKADENTAFLITPQSIDFNICTKTYDIPEEKLFYLAIASARANNFQVNEIQSKTGYILFTAANRQYLASIVKINTNNSMLKITPVNNSYYFAPGIVLNFFKYIDINKNVRINRV